MKKEAPSEVEINIVLKEFEGKTFKSVEELKEYYDNLFKEKQNV